jgi:acetyltransferase-like isoleucine patch superfamily enzyme
VLYYLGRAWRLFLTRASWGWRFGQLGHRTSLGRCRLAPYPAAVSIKNHTTIGDEWSLVDLCPSAGDGKPKIRIGAHCTILHDFQCNAAVSVEIQDFVLIAPRVFVTDSDHVVDRGGERTAVCGKYNSAPVVIENDCWIGVNAVILKGVRIGHHSIVGANSVVTRDIPPFTTAVGIPARPLSTKL